MPSRPGEYRRGGGVGTCKIWNGQIRCGEILAQILKFHGKIWHQIPPLWHESRRTPQMLVACCCLQEASGQLLLVRDGIWIPLDVPPTPAPACYTQSLSQGRRGEGGGGKGCIRRGDGGSEGGGWEGGWLGPPSSEGPPMVPTKGGPKNFEAEILLAPKVPKQNFGLSPLLPFPFRWLVVPTEPPDFPDSLLRVESTRRRATALAIGQGLCGWWGGAGGLE